MFGYDAFSLSITKNFFFLFAGIILLSAYSFYIYKYTLPPLPPVKKYFLTSLRLLTLLLISFILFEPVLSLSKKISLEPVINVFIDNSRSIKNNNSKDSIIVEEVINKISDEISGSGLRFFKFDSDVKHVQQDSLNKIDFNGNVTNFSSIFNLKQSNENITANVIISDGIITDGSSPVYNAEKSGIKVFTVGIGDSSHMNDIQFKNVLHNELIYVDESTIVQATILNTGYSNKDVNVNLLENEKNISTKKITLDESGVNTVSFEYKPEQSGEKKLRVSVDYMEDEKNKQNNSNTFYVNVLSNKINIAIISGSPSSDLTFIKSSLQQHKQFIVNTITQINADKYLEENISTKIDSANVLILLSFPNSQTSDQLLNTVQNKIAQKDLPVFYVLSSDVVISKLNKFIEYIPFTIQRLDADYLQVQPEISTEERNNPLLQFNSNSIIDDWNNLPPVDQPLGIFDARPESKIIAKIRSGNIPRNIPLIITRNIGNKRSIAVLAKDIWKWKLQTSQKGLNLFDNFLLNSVKWLSAPQDKKQVTIRTIKKFYSTGEQINFVAQVYDESFNALNDTEVKVKISGANGNTEINLNSVGSGIYEANTFINRKGDYSFSGEAKLNGKLIGKDNGRFNVGDVDVEALKSRMDFEFLNNLAAVTDGKFYFPDELDQMLNQLKADSQNTSKERIEKTEIRLWSSEYLLILVIILFSIEWFVRKRSGML